MNMDRIRQLTQLRKLYREQKEAAWRQSRRAVLFSPEMYRHDGEYDGWSLAAKQAGAVAGLVSKGLPAEDALRFLRAELERFLIEFRRYASVNTQYAFNESYHAGVVQALREALDAARALSRRARRGSRKQKRSPMEWAKPAALTPAERRS